MQHPTLPYLFAGQPDIVHYACSALKINLTFVLVYGIILVVKHTEDYGMTQEEQVKHWEKKVSNLGRMVAHHEHKISDLATENKKFRKRMKHYQRLIATATNGEKS